MTQDRLKSAVRSLGALAWAVFALSPLHAYALEQYSAVDESQILEKNKPKPEPSARQFLIEAGIQADSITGSGNLMIGPALLYAFSTQDSFGLRGLLSATTGSTYTGSVLYRHEFGASDSRIYLEPSASYSLIGGDTRLGSGALALGFIHDLSSALRIGANLGIEGYRIQTFTGPNTLQVGSIALSPRTSLQLSWAF